MEQNELFDSPCGYFPDVTSQMSVYSLPSRKESCMLLQGSPVHDAVLCQQAVFAMLLSQGFRRSGTIVYRADCTGCRKCIPVRIRAQDFLSSKSQRYTVRKNAAVQVSLTERPEDFITEEKAALFSMYDRRHNPESAKTLPEYEKELEELNGVIRTQHRTCKAYSGTLNMEYRLCGRLIGCAVLDRAADSLSSNYFYYDTSPEIMRLSPGTFSILQEISLCRQNSITWYYLGYWISDCRKMSYKSQFNPHELYRNGVWTRSQEDTGMNTGAHD